jgi:hypothetical protein
MERGILKRLPEVLWQHEFDSFTVLVEFTEPTFFDYIYKSSPPSNLGSIFLAFSEFPFQSKCCKSKSIQGNMPLSLFNSQP